MTTKHIDRLFDYATDRPEGFTKSEACEALDMNSAQFNAAVNGLRRILNDGTVTLTCTPNGHRAEWRYQMVATLDGLEPWVENRLGDAETRFETMLALLTPIVAGTDGRTKNGRRSREMLMAVRQLKERLEFLDEVLA